MNKARSREMLSHFFFIGPALLEDDRLIADGTRHVILKQEIKINIRNV
jgi:hypothetical protein